MPYKLFKALIKRKGSLFEFIWRRCIERIVKAILENKLEKVFFERKSIKGT
jgi:hypothetical protein